MTSDTYEDFAAWLEPRYTGPGSVTVGESMREFTATSLERLLTWWRRYRDELDDLAAEHAEA